MLTGKELGAAIDAAIRLKIDAGKAASKAEVARHFQIQPPSIHDWIKKGTVSKDKIYALLHYFSDVTGPEHWGMTIAEWPSGLSATLPGAEPTTTLGKQIRFYRNKLDMTLEQLSELSGVDVGTINALENRGSVRSKYATDIARALGITVEQLEQGSKDWLEGKTKEDFIQPDYQLVISAFRAMCIGLKLDETDAFEKLEHALFGNPTQDNETLSLPEPYPGAKKDAARLLGKSPASQKKEKKAS